MPLPMPAKVLVRRPQRGLAELRRRGSVGGSGLGCSGGSVELTTVLAWAIIAGFIVIVALITYVGGGWFSDNFISCVLLLIVVGVIVSYIWSGLVSLLQHIFG